jgi:glycosyltransferase involved in cell wall biosynthesis
MTMATPVSLAFVTSLPGWGGGEKWLLEAARAMADRGHRVCVVGQPGSQVVRMAYAAGLVTYPVRLGGWLDPASLWELGRVLGRQQVQVACVNLDKEIRQTGLTAFGRRGFRLVARRGSPDPIKDNWHYRLVYQRLLDRLIVNCHALVQKVCAEAPWFDLGKVRVVYNGCDVTALTERARPGRVRAELGLAPDTPVVALIGEVGWRKGQEILLQAAALLRATHPRTVYLLAGDGDGRAELERRSRMLGLADGTVRFLGFREDVPDLLADCDIVVLPSRREGFPNALLEGMALSRPVVATPVDGIPELVRDGETGALVPLDDANALAAAIGRLLDDPALRRSWGEAGRCRVQEHFSAAATHDAIEDCLTRW